MTRSVWVVLAITTLVVAGNVAMLWFVLQSGFSAKEQPMEIEVVFARQLRHLAMPEAQKLMRNPVPASDEVLAEARFTLRTTVPPATGMMEEALPWLDRISIQERPI